ncbi:GNAT family N-acetyltransferase [Nocardia jejuensis]|uniref:GNAT family N-acetyltransferase n=1 Tax=Nocardia jejuensis TaxID=328049 RepID=UPI000AAAF79C|nr:GNAT family N-acetyltransferase [Nocardia jejuensis]
MSGSVTLRSLAAHDPEPIAAAFTALGWTSKPVAQFHDYLTEQSAGTRVCLVAEQDGTFAGYCTLLWTAAYEPFRSNGIPEIQDLNVLPRYRNLGIGTALLDAVEATARQRGNRVGLGVGLYSDYGPAQRLYVRRGYVPDGRGIVYDGSPVEPGSTISVDDAAVLMLIREFAM